MNALIFIGFVDFGCSTMPFSHVRIRVFGGEGVRNDHLFLAIRSFMFFANVVYGNFVNSLNEQPNLFLVLLWLSGGT